MDETFGGCTDWTENTGVADWTGTKALTGGCTDWTTEGTEGIAEKYLDVKQKKYIKKQ